MPFKCARLFIILNHNHEISFSKVYTFVENQYYYNFQPKFLFNIWNGSSCNRRIVKINFINLFDNFDLCFCSLSLLIILSHSFFLLFYVNFIEICKDYVLEKVLHLMKLQKYIFFLLDICITIYCHYFSDSLFPVECLSDQK